MKRVHKQVISLSDHWHPIDGVPLYVAQENRIDQSSVTVWFEDHDTPIKGMSVKVFGTGHQIPERAEYVGTVRTEVGFVWHVYSMRD